MLKITHPQAAGKKSPRARAGRKAMQGMSRPEYEDAIGVNGVEGLGRYQRMIGRRITFCLGGLAILFIGFVVLAFLLLFGIY